MPKQPQDHKSKVGEPVEECFSFEAHGKTWTLAPTKSVLNPGFVRRHRNAGEGDIFYTLIESLADGDTLEAFDTMSFAENAETIEAFGEHVRAVMGASLGE
jgi:hypothetical protein